MKYYFRTILVRTGEYEFDLRSTACLEDDVDPNEWFKEYLRDFYGGDSDEEDGGFYFFCGEVYVCSKGIHEITKEEYDILKKYIY